MPEAKALLEVTEAVSRELPQTEQYSFDWTDGEDAEDALSVVSEEKAVLAPRANRRAAFPPRRSRPVRRRVVLDRRTEKKPLGMKVRPFLSGFEVQEVLTHGLAADWNSAVPREAHIGPGDKVVQVNDIRGEGQKLLAECSISDRQAIIANSMLQYFSLG